MVLIGMVSLVSQKISEFYRRFPNQFVKIRKLLFK
jgi:hypothetical protein